MNKQDIENYLTMSEPFRSRAEADMALNKFFDMVYAARQECRIADVQIITKIYVRNKDRVGSGMATSHIGSALEAEGMCAYALGQASSDRLTLIEDLLEQGRESKPLDDDPEDNDHG